MASFKDVMKYYSKYKVNIIYSITFSSIFEILDLVFPYLIGQILNILSDEPLDIFLQKIINYIANITNITNNKSFSLLILLAIIFCFTIIQAPIKPWVTSWFNWKTSFQIRRDHLHQVTKKILTLPLSFYEENNPGRIASTIVTGVENHFWTYPVIVGKLIPKLIRIFAIFVIILFIYWQIALLFIFSFTLIVFYSVKYLNKVISQENLVDHHRDNTHSRNSEIITNIKTVKSFATEAREFKRQKERFNREYKYSCYRIERNYIILNTRKQTIISILIFSVLIILIYSNINGAISLGHFITTLTIVTMAYSELYEIGEFIEIFYRRYASAIKLHKLIETPSGKDASSLILKPLKQNLYQFKGKIEFKNIYFNYNKNKLVLQNINISINPHETVALVGHSGTGKSTLVKLLCRYFEPLKGQILVDGKDIQTLDITYYRQRLAIVHQDVDIFNGTILDNLTYSDPKIPFSKVIKACEIARVDHFINDFKHGYYTKVGERGVKLSGGQKQRLGIARALLVNPDILIFDEATSSLDYESEKAIQLAMKSILGHYTTIIIAHRLSTIREADKIIVLEKGKIVEDGSHEDLLNKKGIYHRLHSLQENGELLS